MFTNVKFRITGYTRGFVIIVYTPAAELPIGHTESLYSVIKESNIISNSVITENHL